MSAINFKKFSLVLVLTLVLPMFSISQNLRDAQEAYNSGAQMISENPEVALEHLYNALQISEDLEYEGKEIKELSESLIPRAHLNLAMNLYRAKEMYQTLEQLEKARETAKKYFDNNTLGRVDRIIPQLYNQMGNSEYRSDNFEKAIDYYKKSAEIKADFPDPLLGIALSYEKTEDFEGMLEYLKKTIEVSNLVNDRSKAEDAQRKAKAYLLRNGDEAQKAKKHQDAIDLFTRVLEFDDKDGSIYLLLLANYSELKEWNNVIKWAQTALENGNGSVDEAGIYYQLGTAHQNLGNNQEACNAFSNALSGSFRQAAEYQMKEVLKCN